MIMAEKAEKSIEKVYNIPLRKGWLSEPRQKRSNRAIRDIKAFVLKNTKTADAKLSAGVNEAVFERGFRKPPGKIKVEVTGDSESVQVKLPGEVIEERVKKKTGGVAGLRDRLTGKGEKKGEASKKALKEKLDKELTKEKIDEIIEKAVEEEKSKETKITAKDKKAEDKVEKTLEKVEEAEEKQKA